MVNERVCETPNCFENAEWSGMYTDWGTPVWKLVCSKHKNLVKDARFLYPPTTTSPIPSVWAAFRSLPPSVQILVGVSILCLIGVLIESTAFIAIVVVTGILVLVLWHDKKE